MDKRAKQLKKRIEGLKRSIEEHKEKIDNHGDENIYLREYWEKEIKSRETSLNKEEERLKKRI